MPAKDKQAIDYQVYGEMMFAKCPKCCKLHRVRLMWIGNGTPRVFCQACKHNTVDLIEYLDGSHYHSRAARGTLSQVW